MAIFSAICSLILIVYIAYESALSRAKYERLKREITQGDTAARARFYVQILIFECVSAAMAFAALGFDPARFDPAHLQLDESRFGQWCRSSWQQLDSGALSGFLVGAGGGTAVLVVLLWRRARQAPRSQPTPPTRLSRFLPDFGELVPSTLRERLIFVLVALAAGLCEEVVFRAWLLDGLHQIGLDGLTLVAVACVVFGLAHYYQGVVGMLVTGLLAIVFCGLYVASGTLWLPIIVHAIVDLRVAIMPSPGRFAEQSRVGDVAQPSG